jgi:hypothetical protein
MFVGRKDILEDLESLWRKRTSSLVACRGRRRIGKSTLFREFARRSAEAYIEIEGLPPSEEKEMDNQDQIDHFMDSLGLATGCSVRKVDRWLQAFAALDEQIDDTKRTVVLLDEISWMGRYDPLFPGVLWKAWETMFHRHERLIVVICGSVSSWIQKNILGSTGFAGRLSRNYVIPELSLAECVQFWGEASLRIAPREIFDVLSITGGVPRYLEEIDPGASADENIRRMCFEKGGELFRDFDSIFSPLLGESVELKRDVLALLVDGPRSGAELAESLGVGNNGRFAELLRDLKEGGFVDDDLGKNPATGGESRVSKYRLRDNYVRFYLKYVLPHKPEIERGVFRYAALDQLPEWEAIRGLQFENLIVNNYRELIPYLHIGNSIVESAAPYRNMRALRGSKRKGVQIDLLIQTPCTAYVVEVKRMNHIGSEIEEVMREKIRRLPLREGMSARPVLVYDGELAPTVTGRGYFDAIIPARKLIGI